MRFLEFFEWLERTWIGSLWNWMAHEPGYVVWPLRKLSEVIGRRLQ